METNVIMAVRILSEIVQDLILVRIILQIFNVPYNKFTNFIYSVTEPILGPVRNLLDKIFGRQMLLDFSPIAVWVILDFVVVPVLIEIVRYIF